MRVEFEVPGYVQPKQRTFGYSHATRPETRAYEKVVGMYARLAMRGAPALTNHVTVDITVICAIPSSWTKKRVAAALNGVVRPSHCDVDNQAKSLLDGMNRIVYADDRQICEFRINRVFGAVDKAVIAVAELV